MDIGIVSKPDHCKPHKKALVEMGFRVRVLGPDPVSIPDSMDLLVVRVASVSHGAEKSARMWGKAHNRPVVYENGVSGLRRKILGMGIKPVDHPGAPTEEHNYPTPNDDSEVTLINYNVPSVVNAKAPPLPGGEWYGNFKTSKVKASIYRIESRINSAFSSASEMDDFISEIESLTSVPTEDFDVSKYAELLKSRASFSSDPVCSMVYFYFFASKGFRPYVRDVVKFYSLFTGSAIESRICKAVAWTLGFEIPISAPRGGLFTTSRVKVSVPTPPVVPTVPEISEGGDSEATVHLQEPRWSEGISVPSPVVDFQSALDSNTQVLLELMEEFSKFKKDARAEIDALTERVRFLDTSLELSQARGVSPAPDPMRSIGDLRQILKDAGFRGTITLEVS